MGHHLDFEVKVDDRARCRRAEVAAEEPRRIDARLVAEGQHDPLRIGCELVEGLRPRSELEFRVDRRAELLNHGVDNLLVARELRQLVGIEEVDQVELVVVVGRRGDVGLVGLDVRDLDGDGHVGGLDGRRAELLEGAPVGDVALGIDHHGIGVVFGVLRQILVGIFIGSLHAHGPDELLNRHAARRSGIGGHLPEVLEHGAFTAAQSLVVSGLHQIGAVEHLGFGGLRDNGHARILEHRSREGEPDQLFGSRLRAELAAGNRSVGTPRLIHPVGVDEVVGIGVELLETALRLAALQPLAERLLEGNALACSLLLDKRPVVGLERGIVDIGRLLDVVCEVGQTLVVGHNREFDRVGGGFGHRKGKGELFPRGGFALIRTAGEERAERQQGAQKRQKFFHHFLRVRWVSFYKIGFCSRFSKYFLLFRADGLILFGAGGGQNSPIRGQSGLFPKAGRGTNQKGAQEGPEGELKQEEPE